MMFISKFNALIRNRILWGAFAFLIVVAFVGWGTQDVGQLEETGKVGELDDGVVRAEDFQAAYFNAYLTTSLMFGRPMSVNARTDQALKNLAWRRLAAVRKAQAAGFRVTDEEVAAVIQQQPQFQTEDGRFDPARYHAFIANFLSGMRVTPAQFERYLGQEIMLNKARRMLGTMVWVSPTEVEQMFHQLYDEMVVSYVILDQDNLNYAVDVTPEEIREYFDANREYFRIPEQIQVKYVAFPIADYMNPTALDEETLREYYDEHIEEFTVEDENDWLTAVPFEDVRTQIRFKLAREIALEAALEKASEFELILAPDRQGNAVEFDTAASERDLPVRLTDFFARHDPSPASDADTEFNSAAFELRPTPEDYFSRPVIGDDAVYILAFVERREPRLPDFHEVRMEVKSVALEQAVADELKRLATEISAAADIALAEGQSLKHFFAAYGLEMITTEPFSLQTGMEEIVEDQGEDFQVVLREIMALKPGKMTDLVSLDNGYALGMLVDRRPADRILLASIRSELVRYVRQRREELVFGEWQDYLLAHAEIFNLAPEYEDDDTDEYEDY